MKFSRDISDLLSDLSGLEHEDIDFDKGILGMREFPKILLERSKFNIINKNYHLARKDLKNYRLISKMLEESIGYKNCLLDNNYKSQRTILNELLLRGHFDKNCNEPNRAYE